MKVAIITGASRGIGRAIAVRLAADGISVVLSARDAARLAQVVCEIESAGGQAAAIALDLRDAASAEHLTDFAQERFGGIDILINNAGATKRGEFTELSDEVWEDGFALKFFGAVRTSRAAWRHLKERRGSIVNIAGVGGRTPGPEFAIGGSVNAALLSLTKALADAGIRDGIQVNAVNPGPVRTDRLTARLASQGGDPSVAEEQFVRASQITRIGEPEEIAGLVAFIVSPAGRLLHGALIDMDGGQTKTL
jgi:NAD(P)-dependent dehydrogenase (short-subunit alcohol dehydrogenase family)